MQDRTSLRSDPLKAFCAIPSDHPDDAIRFLVSSYLDGHGCALAFLTDIIEGASRPLGALMAIRDDGQYVGLISGGCVEASVVSEACNAIKEQRDRPCRYGQGSPWFDIVLPCRGGIGLHIHVLRTISALQVFLDLRERRRPARLLYDSQSETLTIEEDNIARNRSPKGRAATGWHDHVFSAVFTPDPQILLFGEGLESRFLTSLAAAAGLVLFKGDMALIDHYAQDCETAIILLHHDLERELPILEAALKTEAFFIGCLGSRKTQQRRLTMLRKAGYDTPLLNRIHGPIGLFGPSREARSVAISVLAEIFALIETRRATQKT